VECDGKCKKPLAVQQVVSSPLPTSLAFLLVWNLDGSSGEEREEGDKGKESEKEEVKGKEIKEKEKETEGKEKETKGKEKEAKGKEKEVKGKEKEVKGKEKKNQQQKQYQYQNQHREVSKEQIRSVVQMLDEQIIAEDYLGPVVPADVDPETLVKRQAIVTAAAAAAAAREGGGDAEAKKEKNGSDDKKKKKNDNNNNNNNSNSNGKKTAGTATKKTGQNNGEGEEEVPGQKKNPNSSVVSNPVSDLGGGSTYGTSRTTYELDGMFAYYGMHYIAIVRKEVAEDGLYRFEEADLSWEREEGGEGRRAEEGRTSEEKRASKEKRASEEVETTAHSSSSAASSPSQHTWVMFDDANVVALGPSMDAVRHRFVEGRMLPLMLFYRKKRG